MSLLRRCAAVLERVGCPGCREAQGTRAALLIALRIRIGLHQLGRFVDQVVLAVLARAADPRLAPEMMVLMDADVAFGRALELDAGRSRRHLVDVEAAGFLDSELPKQRPEIGCMGHVDDDGLLAPHLLECVYE